MKDIRNQSPDEVSKYVLSDKGDAKIAQFMDMVVAQGGSQEAFKALCEEAEHDILSNGDLPKEAFETILELFWPYIERAPAGHGISHLNQDILTAMAIYNDSSFPRETLFASDFWAGILGGILHDIGNSVVPRYADYQRRSGHAEIAAWITFNLLEGIFSNPFRLLIAYAISAHTHYTKPVTIAGKGLKDGDYIRPVYWYQDYNPEVKDWVGMGVILVRAIDRMGTRGVILWGRHLLAAADSVQSGVVGIDLTGKEKPYQVDLDALRAHVMPQLGMILREGSSSQEIPTVLQHMKNLQGGDLGKRNSPYGRNDGHLGVYPDLMIMKHGQTAGMINVVVRQEPDMRNFSKIGSLIDIKNSLNMLSRSLTFNGAWDTLYPLFDDLSYEQLARWQAGAHYVVKEYANWMDCIVQMAKGNESNPMSSMLRKVVAAAL